MNMLISIIIPFYNTSDAIKPCIESALAQTYKNIEIICVNDGSKDNTAEIVSEYQNNDNRIILINQQNGGQNAARCTGYSASKGEYAYFLDSDDIIEPQAIEKLAQKVAQTNADMIVGNIKNVYQNAAENNVSNWFNDDDVTSKRNIINAFLTKLGNGSLCAKLYKRSKFSFENIWIDKTLRANEDYFVYVQNVIKNLESFAFSDFVGYNYIHRGGTMSQQMTVASGTDIFKVTHFLYCKIFQAFPGDKEIHKNLSSYIYEHIYFVVRRNVGICKNCQILKTLKSIADLHKNEIYPQLDATAKKFIWISQSNALVVNFFVLLQNLKRKIKK